MKKIPLTNGHFAIVDDDDYEELSKYKWHFRYDHVGYAARTIRSAITNKYQCTLYMHRQIMNAPQELLIDHINHNGLDNRKLNLRICTHWQNAQNKRMASKNITGFKGIYMMIKKCPKKVYRYYRADICLRGVIYYSKCFTNPIDAALEYDKMALKFHGEFALTNAMLGLLPKN